MEQSVMKRTTESHPNHTFTTGRLETLTDGVFAIVMTLLVLNLSVTNLLNLELTQSLQTMSSLLFQFIFTFLVLAVYWIIHHRIFFYILRTDIYMIWLNLLFLLTIALVPFTYSLLSNMNHFGQIALILYTTDLSLSLIFLYILWWHATRHFHLVKSDTTPEEIIRIRQSLSGFIVIFLMVIATSFINLILSQLLLTFLFFYAVISQIIPMKGRSQILFGLTCIMLNIMTAVIIITLHIPLYLDSWATSLAVILGGAGIGFIVGIVYNLFMYATYWGPSSWVWMFSSILVVIITWYFYKRGWITLRKPWKLILVGILTGVLNTILAVIIILVANLPPYQGTYPIYTFSYQVTNNNILASTIENLCVEIVDKTIAIILAATMASFVYKFRKYDEYNQSYPKISLNLFSKKQKKE
jgi:uncharacterized membrane protein